MGSICLMDSFLHWRKLIYFEISREYWISSLSSSKEGIQNHHPDEGNEESLSFAESIWKFCNDLLIEQMFTKCLLLVRHFESQCLLNVYWNAVNCKGVWTSLATHTHFCLVTSISNSLEIYCVVRFPVPTRSCAFDVSHSLSLNSWSKSPPSSWSESPPRLLSVSLCASHTRTSEISPLLGQEC